MPEIMTDSFVDGHIICYVNISYFIWTRVSKTEHLYEEVVFSTNANRNCNLFPETITKRDINDLKF